MQKNGPLPHTIYRMSSGWIEALNVKANPVKLRRLGHKLYDTRLAMTWLRHQGLDDKRKNGPFGLNEKF